MEIKPYQPSWWKNYLSSAEKWFIGLSPFAILLICILIYCQGVSTYDWASFLLGVLPLFPVIALWFMQKEKNWIDNLPTYLNVTLKDASKRTVAQFEYIPIQNNIDIRQQAQTVLSQIACKEANGRVTNLETFIRPKELTEGKVHYTPNKEIENGDPFELKTVTLHVTEEVKTSDKQTSKEHSIYAPEGQYWYWNPIKQVNQKPDLKPYNETQS